MSMSSDYDIGSYEDVQEMRREARGSRKMAQKTYAPGQAKERQTPFGPVVRWGVKADDLIAFAKQHANERGYINLDIVPRKEQGRFGETHSVVLDDFTPQTGAGARQDDARRNGPARPAASRDDFDGYEPSPFD